ncbi:MAG: Methyltransferase type 12 [Actinomycetia bacterium]|nr:Methyltransferase type 12 [Actinomycetes bacterium]
MSTHSKETREPGSKNEPGSELKYDAGQAAAFYDEYGEREWTRFDDGRTPSASAKTHTHYLERFVSAGDRVLDVGCGPGRFTLELARLGAQVVAADISPGQLELHRRYTAAAEDAVQDRVVADVLSLPFPDDAFDTTVCYGGAVSYVLDRAPEAVAELARVTRPGGHVLVSVMSLVGSLLWSFEAVLEIARAQGIDVVDRVNETGVLTPGLGAHGLTMKMYRWRELRELLAPHGEVVAASATGLVTTTPEEPELRALAERIELDVGAEPGAIDIGHHILAVVRV